MFSNPSLGRPYSLRVLFCMLLVGLRRRPPSPWHSVAVTDCASDGGPRSESVTVTVSDRGRWTDSGRGAGPGAARPTPGAAGGRRLHCAGLQFFAAANVYGQ